MKKYLITFNKWERCDYLYCLKFFITKIYSLNVGYQGYLINNLINYLIIFLKLNK